DNGIYDAGDTYLAEDITDADGHYLITGIPTDADGEAYVVVVDTGAGSPVETSTLTADPNADGLACTTTPEPWADFWLYCDNQVATDIYPGTNFLGADFGYQPSGSFGDYDGRISTKNKQHKVMVHLVCVLIYSFSN
ncbi:MAG: hypothetical protein ABFS02_13700, partial [Pseudomonadota bacterium]